MKNNFEDILNQQGTNEEVSNEETTVVTPEVKTTSDDPVMKFKNHRKHKKNRIKIPVAEDIQESPTEEVIEEPKVVADNVLAVSLDLSSIEDTVQEENPSSSEEDVAAVPVQETSVEEVAKEEKVPESSVAEPAEIIEIVSVSPKKESKKYQLKKEVVKEKREEEPVQVTETPASETVVPIPVPASAPAPVEKVSEPVQVTPVKKRSSKTSMVWNALTFNKDYKRLVPILIGVSMAIVILLVGLSIRTGQDISKESNLVANAAVTPQNDQVSVNKDENLLLMEKAVNEGLPVNHYVLASQYDSLLKETEYPKKGYVLIENLLVQASPEVVNTHTVNGREYSATAVLTTWAVKSGNAASVLEENLPAIKIAVETAFHNKDKAFFEDEKATLEILSFAIERVTGQRFEVENVILKGDFK